MKRQPKLQPTMFIGSSAECLSLARAIAAELKDEIDSKVWDHGVFGLGASTIEDLLRLSCSTDLATFVFGADDVTLLRRNIHLVARDNVVFELGIFMGASGRKRCFFVVPKDTKEFHIPSDLAGITSARFEPTLAKSAPRKSVRTACNEIRQAISRLQDAGLSGEWKHEWMAPNRRMQQCWLQLLQVGTHLRGAYEWKNIKFELRGKIDRGNIVTVDYRSLSGTYGYFGTMQLVITPDGRTISGKWAGWSSKSDEVNANKCKWTRC